MLNGVPFCLSCKVIGALAIPGNMGEKYSHDWYHGDMRGRPNAEDLRDVESFVDDIMKRLGENEGA